jgi:hypothetical protein
MTAEAANRLYERLDAGWERVCKRSPGLAPMIWVVSDLITYMQRKGGELLKEFEARLKEPDEAVTFEMFLIEKILQDPRYREQVFA